MSVSVKCDWGEYSMTLHVYVCMSVSVKCDWGEYRVTLQYMYMSVCQWEWTVIGRVQHDTACIYMYVCRWVWNVIGASTGLHCNTCICLYVSESEMWLGEYSMTLHVYVWMSVSVKCDWATAGWHVYVCMSVSVNCNWETAAWHCTTCICPYVSECEMWLGRVQHDTACICM